MSTTTGAQSPSTPWKCRMSLQTSNADKCHCLGHTAGHTHHSQQHNCSMQQSQASWPQYLKASSRKDVSFNCSQFYTDCNPIKCRYQQDGDCTRWCLPCPLTWRAVTRTEAKAEAEAKQHIQSPSVSRLEQTRWLGAVAHYPWVHDLTIPWGWSEYWVLLKSNEVRHLSS